MTDLEIVKWCGGTRARLRTIFSCTDEALPEHKIRKRFEDRIRERFQAGTTRCVRRSKLWQVADLAMEGPPIAKEIVPLQLFAQGRITDADFIKRLSTLGGDTVAKYVEKDDKGQIKALQVPRLVETALNLVRSFVERRNATQCARFSQLWPYFKYASRSSSSVAKLRADALSQRIDQMADQYNYRHFFPQSWRHIFMYSRAVVFPRTAWDCHKTWRRKGGNIGVKVRSKSKEFDTVIDREGVDFCLPHPSRVFYDTSAPLANLNTDTGPGWIGHWTLERFGNIRRETRYFNRNEILKSSDATAKLISMYPDFFNYYFQEDPKVLELPVHPGGLGPDANDRSTQGALYATSEDDNGLFVGQYYEKVNPLREGICDYPHDVWLWLTVAGDQTVIAADWMPSIPAIYGGKEDDSRDVSMSLVHELLPFQDAATNIVSQMLLTMKADLLQIYLIDQDALTPEMKTYIEQTLKGQNYYIEPQAFFYSGKALKDLGFQAKDIIIKLEQRISQTIQTSITALMSILNLADRIVMASQNEIGQANRHELAATEVAEIANTTSVIGSYTSAVIDEQRAAVKKLLFESFINCGAGEVRISTKRRYEKATVEKAGFKVDENDSDESVDDIDRARGLTIVGPKSGLIYEYMFDSRDGAERAANAQGAESLSKFLQAVLQAPDLAAALGKRRLFGLFNEIVRLSGVNQDVLFELDDGEPDGLTSQQVLEAVQQMDQRLAAIEKALGAAPAPAPGPASAPPAPAPAG